MEVDEKLCHQKCSLRKDRRHERGPTGLPTEDNPIV